MKIDWIVSDEENDSRTLTLDLPQMPVTVYGGSEELVYRRKYFVQFPNGGEILKIMRLSTFIGLDRGDCVEADIELDTAKGGRIFQRSLHKEKLGIFDAWKHRDRPWWAFLLGKFIWKTTGLYVVLICRVTGRNMNPGCYRYQTLSARVHFGVIVEVKK